MPAKEGICTDFFYSQVLCYVHCIKVIFMKLSVR